MQSSTSSVIEHKSEHTFAEVFWRRIREDLRIETLIDKRPKKPLKLYEVAEEDLNIDLPKVRNWSEDNSKLYFLLKENGFADFICNRETLITNYTQLIFDHERITQMDPILLRFTELTLLRLNKNRIAFVENVPPNLKELHLYSNPVHMLSAKIRQEQLIFLGLGYCLLSDGAIENIAKKFPNLVCLDLTHNNLCDLEGTIENIKMLNSIKILSLYGNPLVLLPQYFQSMIDSFVNLKYFDEQSVEDIRSRLVQAEMARQAAIQAELKRQQDEIAAREAEAQKLQDKNKKGAKPAPPAKKEEVPAPTRLQTQPSKYLENEIGDLRISIKDVSMFKLTVNIATLDNLDGVLLDKWAYPEMEQKPELFQSRYWFRYTIIEQDIEDKRVLYDTATIENDRGRIDFEHVFETHFKPSVEVRDFIEKGFLVTVFQESPVMIIAEDGEKKPDIVDGLPRQETKIVGVCKVEMNWLRGTNKDQPFKYRLFPDRVRNMSELWFPYDNERDLVESRMSFIQEEIKKEDDQVKFLQAQIEARRNEALKGGKGKDIKKKDDKKTAKKGKEAEPEKRLVPQLDWSTAERQYVFVNETKIVRSSAVQLAVRVSLSY